MRRRFLIGMASLLILGIAAAYAERGAFDLKVGDEAYFCNCGAECACDTISRNPGKCTCGVDLVKGKVSGVEDGKVTVMIGGKERAFKTSGKYTCACPPSCTCDTVSQNPGNCTCNVPMKKVN